jgi:hypothetical protein
MERDAANELERRAEAVDRLLAADRNMARAAAQRLDGVNGLRREAELANAKASDSTSASDADGGPTSRVRFRSSPEITKRSIRAEVACALRISERTAENLIEFARSLEQDLTATFDALRSGAISEQHARILWEHTADLDPHDLALFEARALDAARILSPARFTQRARILREELHPDTGAERHRTAFEKRALTVEPAPDGMAYLTLFSSAAEVIAIADRARDIARGLHGDPDESRTLTQLQADVAADLLIAGEPRHGRDIQATVQLMVPVLSLLGLSNEPANLDGYGPIDPDTARALTANASSFERILTHPVSSAVLDYDRTRYRPTEQQRAWLRMRDGTCRFPGCGRRARHCEVDHSKEWFADHGCTCVENLANLCTGHHTLKTVTGWDVQQIDRFGTLRWTSPLGLTYDTEAAIRMRGAPPLNDAVEAAMLQMEFPPDFTEPRDLSDDPAIRALLDQWRDEMDAEVEADLKAAREASR